MRPPLSIIVPSFNQGGYISRTIDSILSQNIDGLEILVVDGGSTDNTTEVLSSYGDAIRWISEADKGQTDAINKGVNGTSGEIVAYLNSDDTYEPDALGKVLAAFKHYPDTDILYGDFNTIDSNDNILMERRTIDFDMDILRFDQNYICQPASFWRRKVLQLTGPLQTDLYYYMDYEFFLRAAGRGARFHHLKELLCNLRLHEDAKTVSGMLSGSRKMQEERITVLAPYRPHAPLTAIDKLLHKLLRVIFRLKFLWRQWRENGQLRAKKHNAVMRGLIK